MEKIATPGLYDIPMEIYHGDCCEAHSVSGSGLFKIEQTSLAHYWWNSYLNPERDPPDSPALSFGRAAHAMILGEPEFAKSFVISPYPDFRTKEAREWKANETRTIITLDQLRQIRAMAKTIVAHPLLKNAFQDGAPEQSLIWKDAETGIWLKSRPDWLPHTLQFVPNYKTARTGKPADWARAAFDLGYHVGAALTLEGLKQIRGWDKATYYFVVQEKEAPYLVTPILMQDTAIEWGALLFRRSLRRLAEALSTNKWPGYSDAVVEVQMPAYKESQLLARHEAGEFQEDVKHV